MLSNDHKQFLRSLEADPRWESLLKELEQQFPIYRPSDDVEEEKLKSIFIYKSGTYNENQRILKLLRSTT